MRDIINVNALHSLTLPCMTACCITIPLRLRHVARLCRSLQPATEYLSLRSSEDLRSYLSRKHSSSQSRNVYFISKNSVAQCKKPISDPEVLTAPNCKQMAHIDGKSCLCEPVLRIAECCRLAGMNQIPQIPAV